MFMCSFSSRLDRRRHTELFEAPAGFALRTVRGKSMLRHFPSPHAIRRLPPRMSLPPLERPLIPPVRRPLLLSPRPFTARPSAVAPLMITRVTYPHQVPALPAPEHSPRRPLVVVDGPSAPASTCPPRLFRARCP